MGWERVQEPGFQEAPPGSSPPLFEGDFNQGVSFLISGHLPIRYSFSAFARCFWEYRFQRISPLCSFLVPIRL